MKCEVASRHFYCYRFIATMTTTAANTAGDDAKCPCCNNPWSKGTADMFSQLCAMCEEETKTGNDDKDDKGKNKNIIPDASIRPTWIYP